MLSKNDRYQCNACHHIYRGIPNLVITGSRSEYVEVVLCDVCYDRM